MVNIQRIQVITSGYPGGPGVTTLYALDASAALPAIKGLCADFCNWMPIDVEFAYPTTGDIIDPLDGDLVGTWTAGSRAPDNGGDDGIYAAPVGACINWITGDIIDAHRLTGRTYFVPLSNNAYDLTGSIDSTALAAMRASATFNLAAMSDNLVVWHRPRVASSLHPVARAGGYSAVTSGTVPDRAVVLRSRRA